MVILDRDDEQAHATADELSDQHGVQVPVLVADLATIAGIEATADQLIMRELGPLIPPEDIANRVVDLLEHGCAGEIVEILRI